MKDLSEIRDMISGAYIDPSRDNINHILTILEELAANVQRIERELKRTSNDTSCLANGIKPD